jgi:hypothetical protein
MSGKTLRGKDIVEDLCSFFVSTGLQDSHDLHETICIDSGWC